MRNSKGKFWKDFAMIQEELLLKVVDELNKISIPYMVAGGIAVIFYGRPRLTHDFDIIVEISPDQAKKLAESFKEDFHVDEEAIQEALEKGSMFNLIHPDSGIKIDFWLVEDDPYDKKRFERRQKHLYSGQEIFFSSPEDLILKKLQWFTESEIEKHLDDAFGILEVQQHLDLDYLKEWAEKLNIHDLLNELLSKAEKEK